MSKIIKSINFLFIFLVLSIVLISCGNQENDVEPEPHDHEWGEWVVTAEKVNDIYLEERKCSICDEIETKDHEHTWGEWEVVNTSPEGEVTVQRECSVCYDFETEVDSLSSNIPSEMVYRTNHRIELSTLKDGIITNFEVTTSDRKVVSIDSSGRYLNAKNFGEAVITIIYNGVTLEYTIKVVDKLTIDVANIIPCLTKQEVVCQNAQGKDMPDATLESSDPTILKVNSLSEVEALKEGKVTLTLTWGELSCSVEVEVVTGYTFNGSSLLHKGETSEFTIVSSRGETLEDYEVVSSNPEVVEIINIHQYKALSVGESVLTVTQNGELIGEHHVVVLGMEVYGNETMKRGEMQILNVVFTPSTAKENITVVSDNESVIKVIDGSKIEAFTPGVATITITSNSGLIEEITITVEEVYYTLTFELSDEDKALLPEGFVENLTEFCYEDLPLSLPYLEKDQYSFLGWSINGKGSQNDLEELTMEIPVGTIKNVKLTTCWGISRIELDYENGSVIEPNSSTQILFTPIMIGKNIDQSKQVWFSDNETIAKVSNSGVVTGVNEGTCIITVYFEDNPNISATIGITVKKDVASMSEVVNYFLANAINRSVAKNINVTGYQFNYNHRLLGSVTNYLFEELVIDETSFLVPRGSENRPGDVHEKYYVVVHDTASSAETADARAHGRYVAQQGGGGTSWHYSVGNDGIYHHIPDNERAFHAGDGSRPYHLNETGVPGTNKYPVVTITEDGYYALDGVKTKVQAPRYNGNILTTDKINDMGIRVVIQDGYYFIGDTYYNDTYHLISNTGGNNNSIGMETMVNKGSDIFYTWHKTAQLVAHLVKENNLTLDDVKPHHYFSGKNCPQTMREASMWPTFMKMVECEYMMFTKFAGYKLTLTTNFPEYIGTNGRILKQDAKDKSVSYTITFSNGSESESITLWTIIPGYRR